MVERDDRFRIDCCATTDVVGNKSLIVEREEGVEHMVRCPIGRAPAAGVKAAVPGGTGGGFMLGELPQDDWWYVYGAARFPDDSSKFGLVAIGGEDVAKGTLTLVRID